MSIYVLFEVTPTEQGLQRYLELGAKMYALVQEMPGFIRAERFKSLKYEGKLLSLSQWENLESVQAWRKRVEHAICQQEGREALFAAYKITITNVINEYEFKNEDL